LKKEENEDRTEMLLDKQVNIQSNISTCRDFSYCLLAVLSRIGLWGFRNRNVL